MRKKRKSRTIPVTAPKQTNRCLAGTIHTRDLVLASHGRFLPTSGFGIHGDTKYNRCHQRRADRREIESGWD